jgi:hypothetical protein
MSQVRSADYSEGKSQEWKFFLWLYVFSALPLDGRAKRFLV